MFILLKKYLLLFITEFECNVATLVFAEGVLGEGITEELGDYQHSPEVMLTNRGKITKSSVSV